MMRLACLRLNSPPLAKDPTPNSSTASTTPLVASSRASTGNDASHRAPSTCSTYAGSATLTTSVSPTVARSPSDSAAEAISRTPEATIIAHTITNTPPSTGRGSATSNAPNFGHRPYASSTQPATRTTVRDATPVVAMMPTFCV